MASPIFNSISSGTIDGIFPFTQNASDIYPAPVVNAELIKQSDGTYTFFSWIFAFVPIADDQQSLTITPLVASSDGPIDANIPFFFFINFSTYKDNEPQPTPTLTSTTKYRLVYYKYKFTNVSVQSAKVITVATYGSQEFSSIVTETEVPVIKPPICYLSHVGTPRQLMISFGNPNDDPKPWSTDYFINAYPGETVIFKVTKLGSDSGISSLDSLLPLITTPGSVFSSIKVDPKKNKITAVISENAIIDKNPPYTCELGYTSHPSKDGETGFAQIRVIAH